MICSTLLLFTLYTDSDTVTTGDVGVTKLFITATQLLSGLHCLLSAESADSAESALCANVDDPSLKTRGKNMH